MFLNIFIDTWNVYRKLYELSQSKHTDIVLYPGQKAEDNLYS